MHKKKKELSLQHRVFAHFKRGIILIGTGRTLIVIVDSGGWELPDVYDAGEGACC